MAATNTTQHYQFPLFVATDKPTWLGDWNSAMTALDSAIYEASQTGSGESAVAQEALAKATQALQTANSAMETASSANSTASSANASATSALAKATQNETDINKIEGDISTMQSAINTAQQNIITLQQGLTATDSKASTASTNASTALSTANQAKTTADNASKTAGTANTKAQNAQTDATAAQTAVNNLALRVTTLENNPGGSDFAIAPLGGFDGISYSSLIKITPISKTQASATNYYFLLETLFYAPIPSKYLGRELTFELLNPPPSWNVPASISNTMNIYCFHEDGITRTSLEIGTTGSREIRFYITIPSSLTANTIVNGFSPIVLDNTFSPMTLD